MRRTNFKTPVLSAVAFFGTLGILSVGYSAYVSSYPATATAGTSQLSATEWNKMVTALQTLDTNLSAFTISSGNVGIWASPTQAFEVRRTAAGSPLIAKVANISTTAGSQARFDLATQTANSYGIVSITENGGGVTSMELATGNGVTNGMWFTNGTSVDGSGIGTWPFVWRHGSTERMRITNNGSVGIGTNSPQATLDVNGKIKMQVDPTSNASTADTVPESYKFSRADCNSTTRWSMFVGRFSWDANQDGLCVCMDINAVMEWVCFNP